MTFVLLIDFDFSCAEGELLFLQKNTFLLGLNCGQSQGCDSKYGHCRFKMCIVLEKHF